MSHGSLPAPHKTATGSSAPRFCWTDVAVLIVMVGFATFLICRGMNVQAAAIAAVSTVSVTVGIVLVPRKLGEWTRGVHEVNAAISQLSHLLEQDDQS